MSLMFSINWSVLCAVSEIVFGNKAGFKETPASNYS